MSLLNRFSSLFECATDLAWEHSLSKIGKAYGFEHTLFGLSASQPASLGGAFIRGNFSAQWMALYKKHEFIHIDPRLAHCENRFVPLLWEPAIFISEPQKEMYEEASAHGLCSGIALPLHTSRGKFGMLFFATQSQPSPRVQSDILEALPALSMLRDFALESSMRFTNPPSQADAPAVTPRELECLKWCAAGKTTKQIAQLTGSTEATVKFHFDNLRRKFETRSRAHAVVKATHLGLLRNL